MSVEASVGITSVCWKVERWEGSGSWCPLNRRSS